MAAILLDIRPGDEVIVPSYAFVTTANAFASRGAKVVFADSRSDHPSIDESKVEGLITPKTKAIVALHYGGVACNMETLSAIAKKHSVVLVEDNAQGIDCYFNDLPLGSIGTFGALSFHETKNIHCGEGGAILVNDDRFGARAEVVWDMGTNKKDFREGRVNSYGWADLGSSFYPSELNSAFLAAQMEQLDQVTERRLQIWNRYYGSFESTEELGKVERPKIPAYARHNGHTFYLIAESLSQRDHLIQHLRTKGIQAAFHFQSLHRSVYFKSRHQGPAMSHADRFSNCLIRLPVYYDFTEETQDRVIDAVYEFYRN
jgi:dTDP-4-amino-4,6-dideoxygalactose transaminase